MFSTVLIANRGEIAVRVIRTLRELGIRSVAVYSDADAGAVHVAEADEAVRLGPAPAAESYLSIERVLDAAAASGADAIHPGYGFLSENPAFARACAARGIVFIGPPPEAMEALGDKVRAKLAAEAADVPVLPGLQRPELTDDELLAFADEHPQAFPLMVKAAAGGGGRGMRIVRERAALPAALEAARREARAGFGDDALLVERYVERARHIEVQLLADAHGNAVHLGERECSLQRRHQKVVEESPSPTVSPEMRERLGAAAVRLAREAGYVGAGTAEFIVSADDPDQFFFLEVNARLQVEHPVTELVTGLDLVEQQLLVAAGRPLAFGQQDVRLDGWAIEVRLCAEDPANGFLPATGAIGLWQAPTGPGVRVDSGFAAGSAVTPHYDSLLAKVIAHGGDREQALGRLSGALEDLRVLGVTTNAGFLTRLLAVPEVVRGELDTGLIERDAADALPPDAEARQAAIALAMIGTLELDRAGDGHDPWDTLVSWRIDGRAPVSWELQAVGRDEPQVVRVDGPATGALVELDGERVNVSATVLAPHRTRVVTDGRGRRWDHVLLDGRRWLAAGADAFALTVREPVVEGADAAGEGSLEAPMPGTVIAVRTSGGAEVEEGDVLVVLESMKMEITLVAPMAATVVDVQIAVGDSVRQGQALVELEATA
ncbi:Methylcrotonyl-CoA carboxylase biotin-containing subunit [Patulibacter medicamentivorans]|uniref:biotin carboxylase n=1 Tax=Patulibacter medicamentivorans TaxID=1097667 RepID=H0E5Q0_9ACTN|nr:biotin carboxylase N-terminal domain-containing protein [Patulibacter medicamentivorans]EHN11013.1 Methylcrotonyl-CoA carboxylase biotin-containing subunit [Patulibacter medicamentivorans]